MKHPAKLTVIILILFFVTQLIGLAVFSTYSTTKTELPYGVEPPKDVNPETSIVSITFSIIFAAILFLVLMKFRAETFLRVWFFLVVALAIGITLTSILYRFSYGSLIALIIALPLAYLKIFRRNFLIHNLTELMIYPGIAPIFIPLLNIRTAAILLILISIYDMYAVWHAGFMQKMAKYQIQKLKFFSGFLVPYLGKKEKELVSRTSKSNLKGKKIKVNLAILGGGDVVFPLILAGVVLLQFGLLSALIISIGATLALSGLLLYSHKGKPYPAMPYITAGCLLALGIVYLIHYL